MIYLELFWGFLKVGLFSFGGAYGAIPVIREVVMSNGWITEDKFAHLLAISESTPGPIMVNTATYIGNEVAGVFGAALATFTVCLPAFAIILLLSMILKNFLNNQYVKSVLVGIKPCIIGIILATGAHMIVENCISKGWSPIYNWQTWLIMILLIGAMYLYKKFRNKNMSPIMLIGVAACLGMILFAF